MTPYAGRRIEPAVSRDALAVSLRQHAEGVGHDGVLEAALGGATGVVMSEGIEAAPKSAACLNGRKLSLRPPRVVSEIQYRFNRRFDLLTTTHHYPSSTTVATGKRTEIWLRLAEDER
jgi:hypothetical protein